MALTQVSRGLLSTSIVDNGNATAITIDSSENVTFSGTVTADGGTIVSTGSDAFSSKAVGGYAIQAYQDATSSGHTALDLRSDSTTSTRYLIRGYNDAAGTPTEVFSVGADGGAYLSGNVGIGTSSPDTRLQIKGGVNSSQLILGGTDNRGLKISTTAVGGQNDSGVIFDAQDTEASGASSTLIFSTGGTERMRITSAGRVGIGLTPTYKLDVLNTTGNVILGRFTSTATSSTEYGPGIFLTNDPNNTTNYLLTGGSPSVNRFIIYSNGNIKNQNNSYTGISDEKLKENIVDAGSQWDDIKALRVRKYSFKEENASEPTQIGVVAQEVEAAGMSGLIYETPDQVTNENGSIVDTGEVTKTMKYSILYMKAVKALQEAMTRIETLEAKVQTLENN